MAKKLLTIFFLLISSYTFSSEIENIGIPFITNYDRVLYQSGNQNWCITQDNNNIVWFGNTAMTLWFDGNEWGRVAMSNNSIVRSLTTTTTNKKLVGAFEEFGSIEQDSKGEYQYRSWVDKLPWKYQKFSDIWSIHELNGELFFQSREYIFVFKDTVFQRVILPDNTFHFSFLSNNRYYVSDKGSGLKTMLQNELFLVEEGQFFAEKDIRFVDYNKGKLIVGTLKDGLFVFENGLWMPWSSQANDFLKLNNLYTGLKTENGDFIFGSVQNGLMFCDSEGSITKIINTKTGLKNNTVLSTFIDKEQNLWLGLDQGISYLKINSPFSKLVTESGFGTGYASVLFNNRLYLGTNQGLYTYSLPYNPLNEFKYIKNSEGQVWNLQVIEGKLFCCHHNGLYEVKGDKIELVAEIEGCWKTMPLPGLKGQYICGSYNGLWLIKSDIKTGRYSSSRIEDFSESSRIMEFDKNNDLWMSHGYKGVYKIGFSPDFSSISSVLFFGEQQGLPGNVNNEVFLKDSELLVATTQGFYSFDKSSGKMIPYAPWNNILPFSQNITKVIHQKNNNYYFFQNNTLHLAGFSEDTLNFLDSNTFLPLQNDFFEAFENISFVSDKLSLLGTVSGFVLFNREKSYIPGFKLPVMVKRVISKENNNFISISESVPFIDEKAVIPFRRNNLQVDFTVPHFQTPDNIIYEIALNGKILNRQISQSGNINLTDLREGEYSLTINVSDISGKYLSNFAKLDFEILPPWYRMWYAYIAYLFILGFITYTTYKYTSVKLARIKRREQIMQKRKMIHQQISLQQKALKAEREMIRLKNESLSSENRLKAEEIANSTMELVEKNKILLMVKEKLRSIQKENNIDTRNTIIRQMLKSIDRDLNNDEKWRIFETNFDEVHENFLNRFKEKHPNATPKDLRLCAFLRMNLTSKEIAPLLRISVRSVEISRYRLRQKLNLDHNTNLTNYILHF